MIWLVGFLLVLVGLLALFAYRAVAGVGTLATWILHHRGAKGPCRCVTCVAADELLEVADAALNEEL